MEIVGFVPFGLLFNELKELTFVMGPDKESDENIVNQLFYKRVQFLGLPFPLDFGKNVLENVTFTVIRGKDLE